MKKITILLSLFLSVFSVVSFGQATIGNYVWTDINGNGMNDEMAMFGVNGIRVELHKETSPGSGMYAFEAAATTANNGGNPGFFLFSTGSTANYKVKFPLNVSGAILTNQTTTAATDNNSDASTVDGFSPAFAINTAGSGIALNNLTIDAGYKCSNNITTTGYTVDQNASVPFGEGLRYISTASCGGGGSFTIQIPVNVPISPIDDGPNPVPMGTATMPVLPAGAVVSSANFVIAGINAIAPSWQADVRINMSGAISHIGDVGIGAANAGGTFNYINTITTANVNAAGGLINLSYLEVYDDFGPGIPNATFVTGSPAAGAFINISYTIPPAEVAWYTSATGGSAIGVGSPFNPIGVAGSGLANTSTVGNTTFYAACAGSSCRTPAIFAVVPTCATLGAVAGRVFNDADNDGVMDGSETAGFSGIKVYAINTSGVRIDSATTSINGAYKLSNVNVSSGQLTILFDQSTFPAGFAVAKAGVDNKTEVQFVTAPDCTADMGMVATGFNTLACGSNPDVVVTQFQPGAPSASNVLVKFPYNSSGQGMPPASLTSPGTLLGAVWGLAYQANSNKLFSAAVMRRHAGFGSGGTGAIYLTDINTNTSSLYLDLNTFPGINLGANPHQNGNLINDLIIGANNPFDAAGKISFGDIDFSSDGKNLFAVNLNQRTIHKIFTNNPAVAGNTITAANITTFNIPNPGCTGGTYRPWGLKFHNNKLYVGIVCDGSGGALGAGTNQFAYVYEMDPNTGASTQVLNFPLNYVKGKANLEPTNPIPNDGRWNNWISTWTSCNPAPANFGVLAYPQPILSDIEIDVNGDMIVGFIDRFGIQGATLSPDPTGAIAPEPNCTPNGFAHTIISSGDILRAGKCAGNTWTIESNASVCGATATSGANNGEGLGTAPNNGEFYYQDGFASHQETSLGGIALLPGKGEILLNVFDPLSLFSSGIARFNNTTGARVAAYEIVPTNANAPFSKTNALGDIEVLCDVSFSEPQTIRVGNRIWIDTDGDGVQDPNEQALSGITISIWKGGVQIATATTGANGEYFFSSATGGNVTWLGTGADTSLLPNTNYELRVDTTQSNLIPYWNTPANAVANGGTDQIDNDAVPSGQNAIINFTTGVTGSTIYNLDIGFFPISTLPVKYISFTANKVGNTSNLSFTIAQPEPTSTFIIERSSTGVGYVPIGSVRGGNLLTYGFVDILPNLNSKNFYRIKEIEIDGRTSYSEIRWVQFNKNGKVEIFPSPAKNVVNINVNNVNYSDQLQLKIIDKNGAIVQTQLVKNNGTTQQVFLNNLSSGTYVVSIYDNNKLVENKQLIVIK